MNFKNMGANWGVTFERFFCLYTQYIFLSKFVSYFSQQGIVLLKF